MSEGGSKPEFDEFAKDYESALNEGLQYSGESKDYFAAERVKHTNGRLRGLNHSPARILDFGCGTGTSIPLLLELEGVESVTGSEVSGESLVVAQSEIQDPRASFALNSELPKKEPFDLIFCNGVFHHIPPEQRSDVMKLLHGVLKPGGVFALWENNPWNPGTRYIMSKIPFDRDAVTLNPPETRGMMHEHGFEMLGQDFLFYFPGSLSFLRWMEPAFLKLPLGAQYVTLGMKPEGH